MLGLSSPKPAQKFSDAKKSKATRGVKNLGVASKEESRKDQQLVREVEEDEYENFRSKMTIAKQKTHNSQHCSNNQYESTPCDQIRTRDSEAMSISTVVTKSPSVCEVTQIPLQMISSNIPKRSQPARKSKGASKSGGDGNRQKKAPVSLAGVPAHEDAGVKELEAANEARKAGRLLDAIAGYRRAREALAIPMHLRGKLNSAIYMVSHETPNSKNRRKNVLRKIDKKITQISNELGLRQVSSRCE